MQGGAERSSPTGELTPSSGAKKRKRSAPLVLVLVVLRQRVWRAARSAAQWGAAAPPLRVCPVGRGGGGAHEPIAMQPCRSYIGGAAACLASSNTGCADCALRFFTLHNPLVWINLLPGSGSDLRLVLLPLSPSVLVFVWMAPSL